MILFALQVLKNIHKFLITHSVHVLYNKEERRKEERERSQRESGLKMEKAERRRERKGCGERRKR